MSREENEEWMQVKYRFTIKKRKERSLKMGNPDLKRTKMEKKKIAMSVIKSGTSLLNA